MNMGVDRFYARKSNTYNSISNSNNFCREEFCPTANLKDIAEAQIKDASKPWSFNSLPGVNLKAASLSENPEHLDRLSKRLAELEPLGMWHEPLDLDDNFDAFFGKIKQVIIEKA